MTIKEAFEKLTATTAAAMKNPFFVMRKLHDAFADIADKIEGGGGSSSAEDVSYDNTDSGLSATNVQAAIDEIVAEMPAPYVPVSYSSNEQDTGLTWIDGKKIYQKTIDCGILPNNTTKDVNHSISNIGYVVEMTGSGKNPTTGVQIPIPYVYGNTKCLQLYVDSTIIRLVSTENLSTYTESYVTIRYTKAS